MRKVTVNTTRLLKINDSYEAKSIEQEIRAMMDGETIETKGKQMLYTDKKDGVLPETNIRSDKFALAQQAKDYVTRTEIARRDAPTVETSTNEPTQGTETVK